MRVLVLRLVLCMAHMGTTVLLLLETSIVVCAGRMLRLTPTTSTTTRITMREVAVVVVVESRVIPSMATGIVRWAANLTPKIP